MSSSQRLHRSICVPFQEEEYTTILADRQAFRNHLQQTYQKHPELFPDEMGQGFRFHGLVSSRKLNIDQRRIKLSDGHVYQIRPSFVMPYMIAKTADIEKGLYLRRFGVPFDALAYVFGRDAMFWYRATNSLGRNSLVGTTVKSPSCLPAHSPATRGQALPRFIGVVADEKHTRCNGERIYIATTVADGCFVGAEISEGADTESLTQAYGVFQQEAQVLDADYAPQTVTTDGWRATDAALLALFPQVTILLCFLPRCAEPGLAQRTSKATCLSETAAPGKATFARLDHAPKAALSPDVPIGEALGDV